MFTVGTKNESTRANWLEATLKKIPAGSKILDAGAGECQFKKFCSHLDYVSQDFAQYTGSGEAGLQTGTWDNSRIDIVSDIVSIPVADASFDAVMCTEVFEHIPEPVAAIKELHRILKPGGFLILTSPFASLTHFAPYHYATGFNRFFYEYHLPKAGFDILELSMNGNYFEFVAQEIRRIKQVARMYTTKKVNILERVFMQGVLFTLERLSKQGSKSSELVAFGVHVFARKK